jgi:large subunit ribosomal protein L25
MDLEVKTRTILGKRVKSLRKEGFIPAELFGHGIKNIHLSIPQKQFIKVYKEAGENTVINIVMEDGKKIPALISSVAKNHLKNEILAVDLHIVRMDEKIRTEVPINFTGEAPAVKAGFLLIKVLDKIEVEALPNEIPHRFNVDLTALETVGQSISVGDLKTPEGVKIITSKDTIIATIKERAKEETVAPPPTTEETTPKEETAGEKATKTDRA